MTKPPSQHFATTSTATPKASTKPTIAQAVYLKNVSAGCWLMDAYFVHLVSYIHRNPQRHGFISDFRDYPYSSYRAILEQRSSHVEIEKVLAWFGCVAVFEQYHRQFDDSRIVHLLGDERF